MVPAASSESPEPEEQERRSVLAELPSTRPQRPSARRESARRRARAAQHAQEQEQEAPGPRATATAPAPREAAAAPMARPRRTATAAAQPPTPRQGYEPDSDLVGAPVSPPSGTEVVGALAELAGELAHTGIAAGGRLLRGALSRLSGS